MTTRRGTRDGAGAAPTDDVVDRLADEAERGYDVDRLLARRGRRGRPRLGTAPATVESVRLDPDLKARLTARAAAEGVPVSEVIRTALRLHLGAS